MIDKITKSFLVLAVGGLMFVGAAAAQTQDSNTSGAGPGKVDPGHPRVNEVNAREQNQQDRIANGLKDDTMTPGQAARVENREQRRLNREQNRTSRQIYKDKHDGK